MKAKGAGTHLFENKKPRLVVLVQFPTAKTTTTPEINPWMA